LNTQFSPWASSAVEVTNKYASCPDWHISPHADCRSPWNTVYNTGRHRPCGGMFFTAHMVRDFRQVCRTRL